MKILFTPSDNNMAGAFQSMARLCKILQDEMGYEILVLLRAKGNGVKLLDEYGIKYHTIKSYNWIVPDHPTTLFRKVELIIRIITKPLAIMWNKIAIKKITELIKREKVDIVHLNTTYIYVPAIAAMNSKTPFVWHLREFLEEDQHKRIWNRKKGYELIEKANAVVTISDSLYEKYHSRLIDANLVRIYNGIDKDYYYKQDHELFTNSTISIVMVGTINTSKGQAQAIQACESIYNKGIQNFDLTFVGEINRYAKSLQNMVDKVGLNNNIHFVGLKRDTAEYYKKSDIALVCSRFEAFGRVTVEAMMGGCLVIGANSGGTIELINDKVTGLLYKSGDADDLCKKLEYVITHLDEMKTIAQNGQAYMIENMTARRNATRIHELYQAVVQSQESI